MYFYKYRVKFYDEADKHDHIATGLVSEDTFEEAMKTISRYYGEQDILSVQFEIAMSKTGDAAEDVYEMTDEKATRGEE